MRYADFQPTELDPKGLGLPDRQDWIVAPCSQTRDSDTLTQSNFAACLAILGGEGENVEVHRFRHWGPGWFDVILCHPSLSAEVRAIEARLENYPALDEDDWSERQWNAAADYWSACSLKERIYICKRFRASIFAARRADEIPDGVDTHYLAGDY